MANTTFEGAVRSKNGFTHVSVNATTGAETETTIVNSSGELVAPLSGASMATEQGSGMSGLTAYSSEITKQGKIITTHIFIDIAGIVSKNTANDIIGDDDAANAHIGQILESESGQIISGSMTCLEQPIGGDNDINLNEASVGTGAEDADVTGLTDYAELLNAGDWTLGQVQALTGVPTNNYYLYLSAGTGDTAATYTAGQFLIELIGYEA